MNICHRIDSSYSTGLAAAAQTRVRLSRMTVLDWLLDSDPAIRWQVLRDLVHAPAEVVAAERAASGHRGADQASGDSRLEWRGQNDG